MPDQTLVVGDSERLSVLIFPGPTIDALVYSNIHGRLKDFYQAAIRAKSEEDGQRTFNLLGSLSVFLDTMTQKWRIYAFGDYMWLFVWRALTTFRLTDNTRSWGDDENTGRKILLRLLHDTGFFDWKWTRCKFPLPRLVTSPRARQFLLFLANYDPNNNDKILDIGLPNTILYDARAAKLRIRQEKGEAIVVERVNAERWQWQDARRAPSVMSTGHQGIRVSQQSDEAEDDVNSCAPIPSKLPALGKGRASPPTHADGQASPPPKYVSTMRPNASTSNKGPPTTNASKPSKAQVQVSVPVSVTAAKVDPEAIMYKKFLKETGFYPPPSEDVLSDRSAYTNDLRNVAAKYSFVDPTMQRIVKERVGPAVYSLLVLFKSHPQRWKGFTPERLPNIIAKFQKWDIIPVERQTKCTPCSEKRTPCHRQSKADTNRSACRQCSLGKGACNPPPTSDIPAKREAPTSGSISRNALNVKRPRAHDDRTDSSPEQQTKRRKYESASFKLMKQFSSARKSQQLAAKVSSKSVPPIDTLDASDGEGSGKDSE